MRFDAPNNLALRINEAHFPGEPNRHRLLTRLDRVSFDGCRVPLRRLANSTPFCYLGIPTATWRHCPIRWLLWRSPSPRRHGRHYLPLRISLGRFQPVDADALLSLPALNEMFVGPLQHPVRPRVRCCSGPSGEKTPHPPETSLASFLAPSSGAGKASCDLPHACRCSAASVLLAGPTKVRDSER